MTSEVVVHDTSIRDVVPGQTMGYDAAVRLALADREREEREHGEQGGRPVSQVDRAGSKRDEQGGRAVGSAERHDSGR
jgi:hypothetical protein